MFGATTVTTESFVRAVRQSNPNSLHKSLGEMETTHPTVVVPPLFVVVALATLCFLIHFDCIRRLLSRVLTFMFRNVGVESQDCRSS